MSTRRPRDSPQHEVWDFEGTTPEQYPLLLHFPYFDLYRKQVVKQADLVLALHLCGDSFTAEQKLADFDYYEPLTVRDSSLSACTQAVVAAEVGYLELAYAYFREAALMDLDDLEHNVRDGVHIASLAGAWTAAVAGFGGMRDEGRVAQLQAAPAEEISRLAFRLCYRGSTIAVEIESAQATYSLLSGERAELGHYGSVVELTQDGPATLPIPTRIQARAAAPAAGPRAPTSPEPSRLRPQSVGSQPCGAAHLAVRAAGLGQRQLMRSVDVQLLDPGIAGPQDHHSLVGTATAVIAQLVAGRHLGDPDPALRVPLGRHVMAGGAQPTQEGAEDRPAPAHDLLPCRRRRSSSEPSGANSATAPSRSSASIARSTACMGVSGTRTA